MLIKAPLIYQYGDYSVAAKPPERILAEGYLRLEKEGSCELVYHEGEHSLTWFLTQFVKNQAAILTLCKENRVLGFAWFNYLMKIGATEYKKAEAGIAFFRKTSPRDALMTAAMGTEWAFNELGVDVILSVTPEPNKAAVRFFKRLGREPFGPIPMMTCFPDGKGGYEPCGAYVSAMTKVKWQETRKQFLE